MKKLSAASHRAMPWKNGGGTTIEVARSPEGDSFEDFDWRISMARVESSGPFSRFPGIDRSILVLSGAGMRLEIGGRAAVPLDPSCAPLAFPGEIDVAATLVEGGVEDLNVMTRRGRARALVTRIPLHERGRFAPIGDLLFLLGARGEGKARAGAADLFLSPRDALRLEPPDAVEVEPRGEMEIVAIDLWRR
jgi:environmental stress-induced protein Ves